MQANLSTWVVKTLVDWVIEGIFVSTLVDRCPSNPWNENPVIHQPVFHGTTLEGFGCSLEESSLDSSVPVANFFERDSMEEILRSKIPSFAVSVKMRSSGKRHRPRFHSCSLQWFFSCFLICCRRQWQTWSQYCKAFSTECLDPARMRMVGLASWNLPSGKLCVPHLDSLSRSLHADPASLFSCKYLIIMSNTWRPWFSWQVSKVRAR